MKNPLRQEEWSPYVAGGLLGLVALLALLLAGQLPGSSGAFQNLASFVARPLFPENFFFKFLMPAQITWQVWLLVGVFLGAMASAMLAGVWKLDPNPDPQWKRIFGPQLWKRWVMAFVGGIVLEFAAGIAGGCTSGLAISGSVQLAPAAFLFIPGMFIGGIPTALLIYRKRY
ncbi:MAG: YeeE/YedE thiosulfate transporter family protein [Anaerolineae bacterium]